MAQRAFLVLDAVPDHDEAEGLAQRVAVQYSDETQTHIIWSIDEDLPPWLSVGLADQLAAYKRDAGADACYMTVVMCTEDEAEEIYNEE